MGGGSIDSRDRSRERERDRSRRGDRPSRFSDLNSSRDRSSDRPKKSGSSADRRVYVSNIPYQYSWQDLKDLFRKYIGEVAFVQLFVDDNDKPRGCGVIEFSDSDSVKKCLEVMHRYELDGRKLVVKEDFGNERDKYGHLINGRRDRSTRLPDLRDDIGGMQADYSNLPSLLNLTTSASSTDNQGDIYGNTYGLSIGFLQKLGINGPLINRVFVANLDYKVDEKKLLEVFKLAGRVVSVDLSRDKEGGSRGFAVIEYDHPVESVQAISMLHNQLLFDRRLTVRMDRVKEGPLRLPDGLDGVGLGLGTNGEPLRDVSHNLPSNNTPPVSNNNNNVGNVGNAGLLGALPTQSLQALGTAGFNAAALSSVVGNSALAGLTNAQIAALQASLTNVGGLSNPLLTGDLSALAGFSAAGLNPLTHNTLAANLAAANTNNLTGASNSISSAMHRNEALANTAGNFLNVPNSQLSLNNLNTLTSLSSASNQDRLGNKRDFLSTSSRDYDLSSKYVAKQESDYRSNSSAYNPQPSRSQLLDFSSSSSSRISDTVIVSNLPPSATWQTVQDRFRVIGDIKYVEMRGKDSAIIRFENDHHAKDAVDMMDRIRIDGRSIDVRLF